MPVLEIRALPQPDETRIGPALTAACRAIADAYGCLPNQVWATWDQIPPGGYVEGDIAVDIQPSDSHPPICRLICFEGRDGTTIERTLLAAAEALSGALGIRGNIFIEYAETKSGRVVAGDGILRR
ncbi:MAG: hypothetical protein OEY05_11455 [Paracoccaceae bacterium]|nr:hypothetical protein [Paracoccaceae bacterium]MDH5530644.1 hypothetical protein [Paracoccaceae bacterium]